MEDEMIEIELEKLQTLTTLGYMNKAHYEEHREHVYKGLIRWGDTFEQCLGEALRNADMNDSLKILRYWSQRCEKHAIIHRIVKAKEIAEKDLCNE